MSEPIPVDLVWMAAVRSEYGHCFGCGPDNPIGLHVDGFEVGDATVTAGFRPGSDFRGFHDVLHGGILATALDEILAWTAILLVGKMAVTATLDLRFTNPAPPDCDYVLVGHLLEQRGRKLKLEASCSIADGDTVATAKALFLATEPVPVP